MKISDTRMGMPVTIDIVDSSVKEKDIQQVLDYFEAIDKQFSTYKKDSEVSKINSGKLSETEYSKETKHILALCEETKHETRGYFDCWINGKLDPSGIVKGYAIYQAGQMLRKIGYKNFYVEIAGDVEVVGLNHKDKLWTIGIKNPFNVKEIVKIIVMSNRGIATSGTYVRGTHIYNPTNGTKANDIASMTVIGPNIYEADRFATAAFAMGKEGIAFIEQLDGFEGYVIANDKKGIMTSGFEKYVIN